MNILTLENAFLRTRVDPQGGALQTLFSLTHQQPVLREGYGGMPGNCGLFPMLPVANRVAGNRFMWRGEEVRLPFHDADDHFFLHGDGWLKRWQVETVTKDACLLTLRSQHPCGYDYFATLAWSLEGAMLNASLALTHCGERPMLYGCGFHPFFILDAHSTVQFSASGYWPEGEHHLPQAWQQAIPAVADFSTAQYGEDAWLNVGYSGWNGRATLCRGPMRVTVVAPTPWLMLFRTPGKPFICLEPQTHPVNAHNMPGLPGLQVLSQGESCCFTMQLIVE